MKKEIPSGYSDHLLRRHGEGQERGGVTLRSVIAGAVLSLGIGVGLPYSNMIIKGGLLGHNFNTPAAVFSFFLFVGVVNVLLGLVKRTWEFGAAELAAVYIMAMLATSVPTIGFSEYLLPIIAGVSFYATRENRWGDSFVPHLPEWMVPTDGEAIQGFYEGDPEGGVPWDAWIEPVLWWCLFILAVYWVSICLMVILRRQWMEHERLPYPLVQVPLALTEEDDRQGRRSLIKPFFRSKVMWAGFALPFVVGSLNALNSYFPGLPHMGAFGGHGALFNLADRISLTAQFNFGLLGFAFLLNRDVALSVWLFFLLANVERGVFAFFEIRSEETLSRFANIAGPYLAHQGMGAMIVLVLSGFWAGRGHLRQVVSKACGRAAAVDDSGELLSYRASMIGLAAGLAVVAAWLWGSGLPLWVVPVFLFAVLVVFVALTRAVVEGGIAFIRTPLTPADFVVSGLGTGVLGTSGVVALGLTYVWAANLRLFFMPCFANALRMAGEIGGNRRPLLWAAVVAVLLSLAGSIWSVLTLSYDYGGVNLHHFWFVAIPQWVGEIMHRQLTMPTGASASGWMFTGIGAGLMAVLTWARTRFIWWPLHPLGFAVSTFHILTYVWFNVFLAWAAKTVILRSGGTTLYRAARPFFLGLVMGQIFVAGFWLVVDFFTGRIGNNPIGGSFV